MEQRKGLSRRSLITSSLSWLIMNGLVASEAVAGSDQAFTVGDKTVTLKTIVVGSGHTYFLPHEDESTALAVVKSVVRGKGGRILWLSHGGGRNISFSLGGKTYTVDPNRMFSDKGAKASLKNLGQYSAEALKEVRTLGEEVVGAVFQKVGLVVGMHNNTNGNYSAANYLPGGSLAQEAHQAFVAEGADPDDFFFTTSEEIFDRLKAHGFSVVQQKRGIADDGSLSVRCQRSGVPYVNVEAQHGHATAQKEMLSALLSL